MLVKLGYQQIGVFAITPIERGLRLQVGIFFAISRGFACTFTAD